MSTNPLNGVYVANTTPFNEQGQIDFEAFEKHFHFLSDAGVHGFVPCGTTGESATLTDSEWAAVISKTVHLAKPEQQIIAGCGGNATEKVLTLVREAKRLGAHSALVVTPYYNKPGQSGIVRHYTRIADEGGLPVVMYNIPGRTGVNMTPKTICTLLRHPNIIAVKEATGNLSQWLEIAETADLSQNTLLAGDDYALAAIMGVGGKGIISAAANVLPKHFVEIHKLASSGKLDEAFKKQIQINALVNALFLETNPTPTKTALSFLGYGTPFVREPLLIASDETGQVLRQRMTELGLL